jgi:hydroxyacylglutathione hydrolase
MIVKTITVGLYETNCYIIASESTRNSILIDPGAEPGTIIDGIKQANSSISIIVVTHLHKDHIGALRDIKNITGARYMVHTNEVNILNNESSQLSKNIQVHRSNNRDVQPDILLNDGDSIELDDLAFQVIHTPGHTEGSISLYGHGFLFCGDTLFKHSIGRTNFAGGDFNKIIISLKKLISLPDDTVVYPGHGPITTIENEKRGNPFIR